MARRPKKETLKAIRKRAGRAGFGKAAHNELLNDAPLRITSGSKSPNFQVRWVVSDRLAVSRNPAQIVDHLTDIVMAHHWDAIRHGQKADGSGPQDPVRFGVQSRLAKEGKRPEARGMVTGAFADNLKRGKISVRGGRLANGDDATIARARIQVSRANRPKDVFGNAGDYTAFVSAEAERGVAYFFTTGEVERIVDQAVRQWLDLAVRDQVRKPRFGEFKAPAALHV